MRNSTLPGLDWHYIAVRDHQHGGFRLGRTDRINDAVYTSPAEAVEAALAAGVSRWEAKAVRVVAGSAYYPGSMGHSWSSFSVVQRMHDERWVGEAWVECSVTDERWPLSAAVQVMLRGAAQ